MKSILTRTKSAFLLITFSLIIFSCGGTQKELEAENQQLKAENTTYRIQIDSLNNQIKHLIWKTDKQRSLAEKQISILTTKLNPEPIQLDITYQTIE